MYLKFVVSAASLTAVPGFQGNGWMLIHVPTLPANTDPENSSAPFTFLSLQFSASKPDGIIAWAEQVCYIYGYLCDLLKSVDIFVWTCRSKLDTLELD